MKLILNFSKRMDIDIQDIDFKSYFDTYGHNDTRAKL